MKNIKPRPLRKKLYMMTQDELIEQIKKELIAEGVPFKQDGYGNLWSIRFEGRPAFVAHCDTVIGDDRFYNAPLKEYDGKLSRPGFVLGADDRAGVNLILNHKHKINFILTKDEEIGCVGANYLAKQEEFIEDCEKINFFIELDRKGKCDIIGHSHGYCSKELSDELSKVLETYKENWGVFTDIDSFVDISQGVNFSVGYYNAHSNREYLDIEEFNYIDSKIEELAQIEGHKSTYKKPKTGKGFGRYYDFAYFDDGYSYGKGGNDDTVCDFCGCFCDTIYKYAGYNVCDACAVGIPEDELFENSDYKEDKSVLKCSNCGQEIWPDDEYFLVPDWDVCFCDACVEKRVKGVWY